MPLDDAAGGLGRHRGRAAPGRRGTGRRAGRSCTRSTRRRSGWATSAGRRGSWPGRSGGGAASGTAAQDTSAGATGPATAAELTRLADALAADRPDHPAPHDRARRLPHRQLPVRRGRPGPDPGGPGLGAVHARRPAGRPRAAARLLARGRRRAGLARRPAPVQPDPAARLPAPRRDRPGLRRPLRSRPGSAAVVRRVRRVQAGRRAGRHPGPGPGRHGAGVDGRGAGRQRRPAGRAGPPRARGRAWTDEADRTGGSADPALPAPQTRSGDRAGDRARRGRAGHLDVGAGQRVRTGPRRTCPPPPAGPAPGEVAALRRARRGGADPARPRSGCGCSTRVGSAARPTWWPPSSGTSGFAEAAPPDNDPFYPERRHGVHRPGAVRAGRRGRGEHGGAGPAVRRAGARRAHRRHGRRGGGHRVRRPQPGAGGPGRAGPAVRAGRPSSTDAAAGSGPPPTVDPAVLAEARGRTC